MASLTLKKFLPLVAAVAAISSGSLAQAEEVVAGAKTAEEAKAACERGSDDQRQPELRA